MIAAIAIKLSKTNCQRGPDNHAVLRLVFSSSQQWLESLKSGFHMIATMITALAAIFKPAFKRGSAPSPPTNPYEKISGLPSKVLQLRSGESMSNLLT